MNTSENYAAMACEINAELLLALKRFPGGAAVEVLYVRDVHAYRVIISQDQIHAESVIGVELSGKLQLDELVFMLSRNLQYSLFRQITGLR